MSTLIAFAFMVSAVPVFAAPEVATIAPESQAERMSSDYLPGEVIVKFKNSNAPFEVLPVPDVEAAIAALSRNPKIEFVEPNYIYRTYAVPNDTLYSYQWHFDNTDFGGVHAESAWDITAGAGVTVAVVDTGVAYEDYSSGGRGRWAERYYQAPDLANTCFVAGYDFINDDAHANDDNAHGTHVAGTIAQSTNNDSGAAGLAYESCIMPVKVLGADGSGSTASVANGIYFAVDNGADVINMSLGSDAPSSAIEDAVAYAYANGVTVVAAAGNSGGAVGYPAAYDEYVIAVGATDYNEDKAPYSSYGPSIDVVAPGGNNSEDYDNNGYVDGVLQQTFNPSTRNVSDFGYYFFQGTSMASPHVAGVAAMILANGNATTPDEVRTALEASADDLGATGRDDIYGHGIVNAYQSLLWDDGTDPVPDTNNPPIADFTAQVSDLTVTFVDSSTDTDGVVTSWSWDFGDGASAAEQNPLHTYASSGTHTVTLLATDNDGATATISQDVTVTEPAPEESDITLALSGGKDKGRHVVTLTWTGTTADAVDVYRDNIVFDGVSDSGEYVDSTGNRGGATYTYKVCEADSIDNCSPEQTISF